MVKEGPLTDNENKQSETETKKYSQPKEVKGVKDEGWVRGLDNQHGEFLQSLRSWRDVERPDKGPSSVTGTVVED